VEQLKLSPADRVFARPAAAAGGNSGEAGVSLKITGAFELYQRAVGEVRLAQMPQVQSAFIREGPLSAWVVIWLIIFQRLHGKGTLSVAVRELLTGPVGAFVRGPGGAPPESLSANTSAYSQARSKLPVEVAEKVSDWIFEALLEQPQVLPGLDLPMFLLDGSSILLPHTPDLVERYPPARNRHGVSHWPVMRLVVAHDVVSALAVRPCFGPMYGVGAVSEQGLTKEIVARLPAGCGVLGDRNFGVFSMAWHATTQEHPCLFRLTEVRAGKLNGGVAPCAGTDKQIHWVPSREDRRNNPEIPACAFVSGRLLTFKVRDSDGKWQKLYFFTTLTLPSEQILTLYGYRWNIETDLRSLKREVRLHMLDARSPAMVTKELVLGVAAYNLTRAAINQAASALNLNPRQFSFSLAQDTLNAFLPAFAQATGDAERQQIMQQMLRVFAQSTLPRRHKRPSPPRTTWPRPRTFPTRTIAGERVA
jgi:hypothetical protein